jgi:hypothetical protein
MRTLAANLLFTFFIHGVAQAALHRIHVGERTDVLNGRAFGSAGPYERITGKAYFKLDPKLEANAIITDIKLAPVNSEGLVEFSADIHVVKPRDPAKSNGTVLFEVSNRGNKGMVPMFTFAARSNDPQTEEEFGDKYLLDEGYTLVWLGWQFDVPNQPGLMRLYAPTIPNVTGLVRSEFVPTTKTNVMPLADRNHIPYAVADQAPATLTVRERHDGVRRTIPTSEWKFADAGEISMTSGFQPGLIYEFVYTAKDPAVVGLGPAAIRDLIAFLKYDGGPMLLGDQRRFMKRAIGFGTSQSGRFLRTFLYQGFNADEKGRKVFDGVWPHVAGAGRGSFNFRFAQPSRDALPLGNFFYPTDLFPFSDLDSTDPQTKETGSLLAAATKQNVVPKIFYTNGSYEYWGRAASLIHTTPDGKDDAPPATGTRIYYFTGAQHGNGSFPPGRSTTRYTGDPLDYRFQMRALLAAMNDWLTKDKAPPPPAYPLVSKRELTSVADLKFPGIPEVNVPSRAHTAYRVDYGPEFRTLGRISIEPPKIGPAFTALVPQVDKDGIEMSGIRLPEIQHPLATYTGWNFRDAQLGAPDEMISFIGSWFPFARTKAERAKTSDPRPSIEERYPSKEAYIERSDTSAKALASSGYVLARDLPALHDRASRMWDYVMSDK